MPSCVLLNFVPQLVLLDGVMFKERGGDGRQLGPDDLRVCTKLNNHRVSSQRERVAEQTAFGWGLSIVVIQCNYMLLQRHHKLGRRWTQVEQRGAGRSWLPTA